MSNLKAGNDKSVVYARQAATHKYEVYYKRHDKYDFEYDPMEVFYSESEAVAYVDKQYEDDPSYAYEVRKEVL